MINIGGVAEQQYKDLVARVLRYGEIVGVDKERTGTGTIKLVGESIRFDLEKEFPLYTGKKTFYEKAIGEAIWLLQGKHDTKSLSMLTNGTSDGFTVWDANFNEQGKSLGYTEGELGKVYGYQLRNFGENNIDQLKDVVDSIKSQPYGRRHIFTLWNPTDLPLMTLPPCHSLLVIFNVFKGRLFMETSCRSNDLGLGNPFNMIMNAVIMIAVSQMTGYPVGDIKLNITDAHIYMNHVEGMKEYLKRPLRPAPTWSFEGKLETLEDLENLKVSDFKVHNYDPHPFIKLEMAV